MKARKCEQTRDYRTWNEPLASTSSLRLALHHAQGTHQEVARTRAVCLIIYAQPCCRVRYTGTDRNRRNGRCFGARDFLLRLEGGSCLNFVDICTGTRHSSDSFRRTGRASNFQEGKTAAKARSMDAAYVDTRIPDFSSILHSYIALLYRCTNSHATILQVAHATTETEGEGIAQQ